MKVYEAPEIKIVNLSVEDIITASGDDDEKENGFFPIG